MKSAVLGLCLGLLALAPAGATPQPIVPNLSTTQGWRIMHADVQKAQQDGGRPAVRLVAEGDSANGIVGLALPPGAAFATGTIAIDLKGRNLRQRSFLGVAFNVVDAKTFEAVYFRPFNFKADDPFRGRAVQYIAWPTNTWEHLRKTQPGRFEQPLDPAPDPDGWFHAEVEVTTSQVRVFVNHAKTPSLVVARLSSGAGIVRPVGLFVDSADRHYANLTIAPLKVLSP